MRYSLILLFCLTGCSSRIADAQAKYDIVKRSGSAAEICAQGAELVAAYLAAKDAENYEIQKTSTAVECQSAEFEERDGNYHMPDGSKKKIEADKM